MQINPFFAAFQPLFAYFKRSRYAEKFLMMTDVTQINVLEYVLVRDDDDDEEFGVSHSLLHPTNPCHFDIWLVGIENGVCIITSGKIISMK